MRGCDIVALHLIANRVPVFLPAGGGTAPDGCVDHSGDDTLMDRLKEENFHVAA
jgi:hypothetical protein